MGKVIIPYYVVKSGRGFWQPSATMRAQGARPVPCGVDGPGAWECAKRALDAWTAKNAAQRPSMSIPAPVPGSLGAAFADYRRTGEWPLKSPRTREEWDRCWARVGSVFAHRRPASVTMAEISTFRALVEAHVSRREAHRCIKIWRALWKVAASLKYCQREADPSLGVRNITPQPRNSSWTHLEAIRLAKVAWRAMYRGIAALIAVSWDTSLSPVDVRGLALANYAGGIFAILRAKTGRSAIGTLSRRSQKVLDAYLATLPALIPTAPIFRNRSGQPYSKDTLGDDFRKVREMAFGPGERRTLADFRRSGVIEAVRGGAESGQVAAKLGNEFDKSAFLRRTYAPVDLASVRAADEARKRGRK